MTTVPNKPPFLPSHLRIALVGEAPGGEEVRQGIPFVGASGQFLAKLLARAGVQKDACFVGNVCQHQPPGNDISAFDWNGEQIQFGMSTLLHDVAEFNPNIVVCLGGAPLQLFKEQGRAPRKHKKGFKWDNSPTQWRGSLFQSLYGYKCLSTLHPAFCLRSRSDAPFLQFDLKKAVREGASPTLSLPKRAFDLSLSPFALCAAMRTIQVNHLPIAIDIEGGIGTMSCVSIASRDDYAFIVPFFKKDFSSPFSASDEARVWRCFAELMEDPLVPKILQNSLYDRFVLHYSYGIRVRGVVDDTMLKWWELYAELEKSLSVQASICTNEPYYKGDRKAQDDKTFFEYCCRDSAVTYEINTVLNPRVHGTSLSHYHLNIALLNPLLYMEMRGISYDSGLAATRRADIRTEMFEQQARLNGLSGRYVKSKTAILDHALELMYYKKADASCLGSSNMVRKPYETKSCRLFDLLRLPSPTLATIGEIEDLLEVSLNVDSKTKFPAYLYQELALPLQYAKQGRNSEEAPSITSDYEALLKLVKHCEKERPEVTPIIQTCIEIRSLGTREAMLAIRADNDGRVRCGYNLVGSDTGRITCYTSPTGSGYNLQTIPKADRDLFLADEGHWLFQCDLSGADGWTVAAYCAMLGDTTMLDDYRAGLKPAKILVLALRGSQVNFQCRDELRAACKTVDSDSWDYFGMKRVQHGCSYLEGEVRVSNQILTDSEGKFIISPRECRRLRDDFFFKRYPGIQRWHRWMYDRIRERPTLIAASGQVRQFFGVTDEILPKAVAFEPQANTTYATNLAMYRLWTDKDNRVRHETNNMRALAIKLLIEPLHQVHDALIGQFRKGDTPWSVGKINEWFNNAMVIAGQRIVIPFEGGYGKSWGQAGDEKKREGVI